MAFTRRTFVKGTAALGAGGFMATRLWDRDLSSLETLVSASPEQSAAPALTEEWVPTTCWIGKQDCGLLARRVNGRVIKLEGNPANPRNNGRLCPKGVTQVTTLYDPKRLKIPLVRTNMKGVPGEWREASWDEALELVADRLMEAIEKDERLAAIVPGRDKVSSIYGTALRGATGISYAYGRRGNDCGGGNQDAVLATWGVRSQVTPDLRNCRYLICYWNLTQAGGPSLCQVTYPQEVSRAKGRGMKVVSIDPYARSVANQADEWVPIKPGTDMAFWLAVINVLLAEGYIDEAFLKTKTNACSLVKEDGSMLLDEIEEPEDEDEDDEEPNRELVWDTISEQAALYSEDIEPALMGDFEVDGVKVKTAFQVFHDHVQEYTPEWAAEVCGLPASQITRIAQGLGQNAMIGSTTVIDGVEVPYRPVAYGIHGTATKFHSSLQTNRAILLAFMVLGAVEAAGSAHLWDKKVADPRAVHAGWLAAVEKEEPDRLDLGGSKWFPLGSSGYVMFPNTVNEPEKYGLDYRLEDMAILVHFVNPVMNSRPMNKAMEAWSRFGFVSVVTPYLTATADYTADVVLPCGTLDKWEGPIGAKTLYESADTVRAPIMEPLGQSKGEIEIYTDLCEKMGKLYGEGGFIDQINQALSIEEEFQLSLDEKPRPEQILDAWARSKHGVSLQEFQETGVATKPVQADELYLSAGDNPFNGVRGAFYIEAFQILRSEMRARDVPESLWSHYSPYPTWTEPALEQSDPEYDLYLMDFKKIEHKHSRTFGNPLLDELMPENPLIMNTRSASERGLEDGDEVWVESQNPVTGDSSRITTTLATTEGIRPDTVALTHHVSKPTDPSANQLFLYGDGFWDMGSSWFSHVKVRVGKA